ncbi:MAG TPA: DUF192 domain-containing protein [Thermoanaerobacterales bacterium]|nr:DUF192 domain-containing protein [Thermoanaerobacterales bacterium]
MKVLNVENNTVITEHLRVAVSFWSRLKGLLGTDSFPEGSALLLKPCSSIHTFFMRYPIDAVFLDGENRVIYILHSIVPYRLSPLIKNAQKVLELPAGRCRRTAIEIGNKLEIIGER